MKRLLLFLSFYFIPFLCFSQKQSVELATELLGGVYFSTNGIIRPFNNSQFNYQRKIQNKLYVVIGGTFNKRTYNDNCANCRDGYGGELKSREWNAFSGARYYLRQIDKFTFNYFNELNFNYKNLKTSGEHYGGLNGRGHNLSQNNFRGYGFTLKLGTRYNIAKRIYLGLNTSWNMSWGDVNRYYKQRLLNATDYQVNTKEEKEVLLKLPLELRLGYRF